MNLPEPFVRHYFGRSNQPEKDPAYVLCELGGWFCGCGTLQAVLPHTTHGWPIRPKPSMSGKYFNYTHPPLSLGSFAPSTHIDHTQPPLACCWDDVLSCAFFGSSVLRSFPRVPVCRQWCLPVWPTQENNPPCTGR